MKADGYSLDDKRNPIAENDITDIIERFNNLDKEEERTRKDKSFLVPVEEIREKGYDLSINKYKEIEREKVEYEASDVILARINSLENEIVSALNDFQTKFM
jgi:type I restriction enzyme M protein